MPKISVIIPNYNHAAYLKERIDSVLTQTYQDFEVILLDDCSTDNSHEIIERYRNHPKISTIIYGDKNSGSTFIQWKKGIEAANGEWIWIAESDDWCESSLLRELINAGIKYPECTLSYCQSIVFNENEIISISKANRLAEYIDGKSFVVNSLLKENIIVNASMCIFKRAEYLNVSQEFTTYQFMGDCLFWIEIALRGKVYISGKTLNYFRKHTNDVSSIAHRTGLYYSEYIRLLQYVDLKYRLLGSGVTPLVQERYKLFLRDKKIEPLFKKKIGPTFKKHLGLIHYSELLRYYKQLIKQKAKFDHKQWF